jgi:CheY-like chemotaxis protein
MKWLRPQEGQGARLLRRVLADVAFAGQHLGRHGAVDKEGRRLDGAAVAAAEDLVQRNAGEAELLAGDFEFGTPFVRQLALRLATRQVEGAVAAVVALQFDLVVLGAAMAQVDHVTTTRQCRRDGSSALDQRCRVAGRRRREIHLAEETDLALAGAGREQAQAQQHEGGTAQHCPHGLHHHCHLQVQIASSELSSPDWARSVNRCATR